MLFSYRVRKDACEPAEAAAPGGNYYDAAVAQVEPDSQVNYLAISYFGRKLTGSCHLDRENVRVERSRDVAVRPTTEFQFSLHHESPVLDSARLRAFSAR